jgi:hypothetical protein
MDLTDVYRIFHSISPQFTFFSAVHGTFSKTDRLRAQSKPQQYKKIEITPSFPCDHNALKQQQEQKTAEITQIIGGRITHSSTIVGHRRNKRGNQKVP